MIDRTFDVAIGGAGPVGLMLAAALAEQGARVAVFEAGPPPQWSPEHPDIRISSLTPASRRMLERVGVWPAIAERRLGPFEAIHAWDAGGARLRFHAADLEQPALGYLVEHSLLQTMLDQRLHAHWGGSVLCRYDCRIDEARTEPSRCRLRLGDGGTARARLLVAADGAGSALRQQMGIGVSGRSYGQHGLVATVRPSKSHGRIARQRFMPGGPLALLPVQDDLCSIVWSLPDEEAKRLQSLDDTAFLAALTDASEAVLGPIRETGPRHLFPLRSQQADSYVAPRFALVGDAAHVIHPLAGQGVNLGLLDAAALAQVVGEALQEGVDPGAYPQLRRYARWRRSDNLPVQWLMDGFHWLFSNSDPVRQLARNLGFLATERLPPAKRLFTALALHSGAHLPRLASEKIRTPTQARE
ncbi:UbiH/UbiF/VisC/COQ6 family ubiquinone biosynthesis hydroxylase [Methylonatrum kenyense]|uniref:UbiH/UbiF/VisC/COQ6 family ubiquinone biosynthesis hydroxylase n=1 Tax=Methylonatrum kenyense TaxID=455253 RepID=UPI0020C06E1B|nr:UbiH/UbiF/VisC/COQ6 family ubiquinone biosynthesis hydroxylase [Methylonatrum kenyense]